jgi:tRNA pseudouridine55 synthase
MPVTGGSRPPAVIDPGEHGGLLIIDKPAGLTSHDVVARVRRLAGTRRVGHAGTLDPMATGVLVIGIEKATRLLGYLMLTEKTYEATIRLGQSTSTDDAEGEPTGGSPANKVTQAPLHAEIVKLTGDITQVPPGVSAIKVNGQRAYKLTRAGAAPELKPRPVTVYEFTVTAVRTPAHSLDVNSLDVNSLDVNFLDVDAVIRCSSGTYIRALARDLGQALGTGGHLAALRRTAVGPYRIDQAKTLERLENQGDMERVRPTATPPPSSPSRLIPLAPSPLAPSPLIPLAEAAAAAFPRINLTADEARRLAQGARLPLPAEPPTGSLAPSSPAIEAKSAFDPEHDAAPVAAFAPDGTLVALVAADAGRLRSLAVFASPTS